MKLITTSSAQMRKTILCNLDEEAVEFLAECVSNILNPGLKLGRNRTNVVINAFKRRRDVLKYMADPRNSYKTKRDYLIKHGKGFGAILAAVLPIISSIIASKISK